MSKEQEQQKEATLNNLRTKAIQETEKMATSQRFGLFSSPVPLSLGDNSYDHKERPARNEMNKPVTSPPNMKIKAPQQGKIVSSYFSNVGYTTIKDPYVDPDRRIRIQEMEEKKKYKEQDPDKKNFVPPSGYKEQIGSTYEHRTDFEGLQDPKRFRDKDGRVKAGPKNVTTNQQAKSLQQYPKHMKDEYNRYHQFESEKIKDEQKRMKDKVPFKSTVYTTDNFQKDKDAFNVPKMPDPPKKKEIEFNIQKHDGPFKPSHPTKTGEAGYLGKYPPYKGDPLKPTERRDLVKTKDPFKPQNFGNTARPTPSISCFPHNLKRELNSRVF